MYSQNELNNGNLTAIQLVNYLSMSYHLLLYKRINNYAVKTRSRVLRAGFGSALADSLPIRIRAHPAERFNSVGACTPTEYSLT